MGLKSLSSRQRLIATGVIGLVILTALLVFGGKDAVNAIIDGNPLFIALAFAIVPLRLAISSWRWARVSNSLRPGEKIPYRNYLRAFSLARLAGLVLPRVAVDLVLRPLFLKVESKSRMGSAIAAGVVERLMDASLAIAAFAVSLLLVFDLVGTVLYLVLLGVAMGAWVILFVLIGSPALAAIYRVVSAISSAGERVMGRDTRVTRAVTRLGGQIESAGEDSGLLRIIAITSLVRYASLALQIILITEALEIDEIGPVEVLAIIPFAQIAVSVAFTPGELGFVEGGYFTALALLGVTGEPAAIFVVGQRILFSASSAFGAATVLLAGFVWSLRSRSERAPAISDAGTSRRE